jgi:hypothetical protein
MAGGGSTIMGVPETGSVRPFVSTQRDGKRGTYALMADGSVRWISENISDDVFKALCTVKGGETVLVNREAPLVPRPEGQQELKVVTPPPIPVMKPKASPPPSDEKKPDGANDKVVSILNQKCARCHTGQRAQGKPPYQLFTGPGVLNPSAAMDRLLEVLESGKMPPQKPGMNNPRLTDEETTILQKWAQSKH